MTFHAGAKITKIAEIAEIAQIAEIPEIPDIRLVGVVSYLMKAYQLIGKRGCRILIGRNAAGCDAGRRRWR